MGSNRRRWTVIASGLLCFMLALVVLFTTRGSFRSPLAVVVVAAIGLAAVLLQLRTFNRDRIQQIRAPLWLNSLGIVLALVALFSGTLRLRSTTADAIALAAVGVFAISSTIILNTFRKRSSAK
jgi:hypothetical protein